MVEEIQAKSILNPTGGFLATYKDPGGATIYVMDQSTDQNAPQG